MILGSLTYCPTAPTDSLFHAEAELLQSRLSPHTGDGSLVDIVVLSTAGPRELGFATEHRLDRPAVHQLVEGDIAASVEKLAAHVAAIISKANGLQTFDVVQCASNSGGGAAGPPLAAYSGSKQLLSDSFRRNESSTRAWLSAHTCTPAYAAVHPAAWTRFDTAAWLESRGQRYTPVATKACSARVDGRTLLTLPRSAWSKLLATQSGTQTVPTEAMVLAALTDLETRVERQRRGSDAADTPWQTHLTGPLYRCKSLARRPAADIKMAVREICDHVDTADCGSLSQDALWAVLALLGISGWLTARTVVSQLVSQLGQPVDISKAVNHLADAVARAILTSLDVLCAAAMATL